MSFDQESLVYGVIRYFPYSNNDVSELEHRTNQLAIQDLPTDYEDDTALIRREMFASTGKDIFSGSYQTRIIHFAASYRAVEYEWEHWLSQFETLLKKMYWYSATVHLETELSGKHTFTWHTDYGHAPSESDLSMQCEWEREASLL